MRKGMAIAGMVGICLGILGSGRTVMDVSASSDTALIQAEVLPQTRLVSQANPVPEAGAGADNMTSLSQIMSADRNVDMKAEPAEESETLMTYEEGALLFVTGETEDGWYRVIYQDKVGYVDKSALHIQEMDVEGLAAEMAANEEEGKLIIETVEKYRAQARRSRIWGGVIIVLVFAIFAVGIISAIRSKQEEGQKKSRKQKIKIEDWNE